MTDGGNFAVLACAPTRRQLITGAATVFVSSLIGSVSARASTEEKISHTAECIHQETLFKASRKRVYDALTDDKQFDKVMHLSAAMQSGMALGNSPTAISREVGGPFTLYGGHILGRHIELVPNERIVQAWRVATWSPGVYSIARFELSEQGSDTKLVFDHTGFPEGQAQHLAEGWKSNYWEPLAKFLA
jgi:activator of HSP90 ATPase